MVNMESAQGICCKYLDLIIESGVLEDSDPLSDFDLEEHLKSVTEDDDDIIEVPFVKADPPVFDLSDFSDEGVLSSTSSNDKIPEPLLQTKTQTSEKSSKSKSHQIPDRQVKKSKGCLIKRSKDNSYSRDDSLNSRGTRDKHKHRKVKEHHYHHSISSGDEQRIKKEYDIFPDVSDSYGLFYCEVCNIKLNSEGIYYSHIQGKRHQKATKQLDVAKAVAEASKLTANCALSRYPFPAENITRVKVNTIAKSQRIIYKAVSTPCPGLERVIEIQGLQETKYYCKFCDAPCAINSIVPHLSGFKHQLNCIKYFAPDWYEKFKSKRKQEVEFKVLKLLQDIEKKRGKGNLTVEKDIDSRYGDYKDKDLEECQLIRREIPGPSHSSIDTPLHNALDKTLIPDMSKNDFYCQLCDSHMNNSAMWESHIRGKRHLKNLKKAPGEAPSKSKAIRMPHAKPLLLDLLRDIDYPVVGLKFIKETQNPDIKGAQYNCFLCGACVTQLDIVSHIISQKHMTKFLDAIKHPSYQLLKKIHMNESGMYSIILEECAKVETEQGRGEVEVYIMKK